MANGHLNLPLLSLLLVVAITGSSWVVAATTSSGDDDDHHRTDGAAERLIREIVMNQDVAYYDELVLEQLLAAANETQPSPETWRTIVDLLRRSRNGTGRPPPTSSSKHHRGEMIIGDQTNANANLAIDKKPRSKLQSAIEEFPPDFMSEKTRQNGGFVVHILIFTYLSVALAIICDNYFLQSLEYISEALHLPSDIAGATFMAIGTSAPELFTSVIGVFISDNDIGTGTIVGSAVFNLIAIPGACGFAAYFNLRQMPKINPFPIIRDTIFYVLTITTLILCIKDNRVDWIESITLIALYIVYIVIMYFNAQISHVLGNKDPYHRRSSHDLGYQNLDQQSNRKQKSLEAESQPLLLTDDSVKRFSPPPAYHQKATAPTAGTANAAGTEPEIDLSKIHLTLAEDGKFREIVPSAKSRRNDDLEQSTDDIDTDWSDNSVIRVLMFPFHVLFLITLPKPTRFCYVITFISSIVWIACLTYVIVWMVTLVGYTLGVPDTVSGITVLAAGTSIPELISSYLIVKKAGLADMAICNSIGSNIFDILFCLGLPWLLKSSILIVTSGIGLASLADTYIPIQSTALPITSLILLLTIGAMIVVFKASRWRLNLRLGILCTIIYILFVISSISLELNV